MNQDDAKEILRLYRPGTPDAEDPQIAAALELAASDRELGLWLERYRARQLQVREQFRQVAAPPGLMAQIISEQNVRRKVVFWRQGAVLLAAAAVVLVCVSFPFVLRSDLLGGTGFPKFRSQMTSLALKGYPMYLVTTDPLEVRGYFAQSQAPADFVLPATLQKASLVGCTIVKWHGKKVSMACYRTGLPLDPGQQNDMWLFIADQSSVKQAPELSAPQFAQVGRMATASWEQDGKVFVLGTTAGEPALRKFL